MNRYIMQGCVVIILPSAEHIDQIIDSDKQVDAISDSEKLVVAGSNPKSNSSSNPKLATHTTKIIDQPVRPKDHPSRHRNN